MTIVTDSVQLVSETASVTTAGASYTRTYQMKFIDGYSAAALIHNTEGDLPKVGEVHPDDSNSIVETVNPKLADSEGGVGAGVAIYEVSYKPIDPSNDKSQTPTARNPEISWGGSDLSEVKQVDVDGVPKVNSAGDLYDPIRETPIRGGEVTITYNVNANPADFCVNFSYTTNDAEWYGVAVGNGLIGKITASKVYEVFEGATIEYWKLTVPIRFNRDGWKNKIIDNGFRKAGGAAIVDDMGHTPPVPVLLDGAGGELAMPGGTPVVFPTDGFRDFEEAAWDDLAIPNPFA